MADLGMEGKNNLPKMASLPGTLAFIPACIPVP